MCLESLGSEISSTGLVMTLCPLLQLVWGWALLDPLLWHCLQFLGSTSAGILGLEYIFCVRLATLSSTSVGIPWLFCDPLGSVVQSSPSRPLKTFIVGNNSFKYYLSLGQGEEVQNPPWHQDPKTTLLKSTSLEQLPNMLEAAPRNATPLIGFIPEKWDLEPRRSWERVSRRRWADKSVCVDAQALLAGVGRTLANIFRRDVSQTLAVLDRAGEFVYRLVPCLSSAWSRLQHMSHKHVQ